MAGSMKGRSARVLFLKYKTDTFHPRFIISLALRANVPSECLKLISAVIVALAIAAPALKKNLALRRRRAVSQKGGKTHA